MNQTIQTPCQACELHKKASTVGMKGHIGKTCKEKLMIVLDSPAIEDDKRHKLGESNSFKMLKFLLSRLGISMDDVAIVFVLRCFKPKNIFSKKAQRMIAYTACRDHLFADLQTYQPKAIVAMGTMACESLMKGAKVGDKEGCQWISPTLKRDIWISYSPAYAVESPGETGALYRVLFKACKAVKMEFKPTTQVPAFDYGY